MASSPRIDELRKKFEENPRRYFAPLANEYRKAGDVEQAIAICREYLPQQPGHMSGHIVFGQALYEARSFDEAKTVFETALSLDPENLIALRHLGDISLITGDTESARTWYKRVLEADPRNEEIQAQLASIDQASSSAPTPAITPAVAEASAPPAPAKPAAPSSAAATVVMQAVQIPGRPIVTATSPTAEINAESILSPAAAAPAPPTAAPIEPTLEVPAMAASGEAAPPPLEGLEATHAGGAGETPVSSFSLDGLETTSMAGEAAAPAPAAAPLADLDFGPAGAPPPALAPEPTAPMVDLDFESAPAPAPAASTAAPTLDLSFDAPAPPPATASLTPAPAMAEAADGPALDLDLGSLAPPPPAAPAAPEPSVASAPAIASADEAPLDLEISLPSPSESAPAPAPAPAPVTMEAPEAPEAPETPEEPAEEPQPALTSAPFMTETMAELYLQQGHREEALRVYRALLEQRPGDSTIAGRIAGLERDLAPPIAAGGSAGPSIRELLLAIASRRPGHRPEFPSGNGTGAAPPDSAAVPSAPASSIATSEVPAPASPGEQRGDALGQALQFTGSASSDEAAATVLARAFRQNGHSDDAPLIAGAPARPAADELSLRTVFKSDTPPAAPSSFSFDQFFSQRASAEPSAAAPEGQAAESPEEVAHFTQWLEGLKKR